MDNAVYARLFSSLAGLLLVVIGMVGFLVSAQFSIPEITGDLAGFMPVNGWANSLHVLAGLAGLALAGSLPRLFALLAGLVLTGLGIWGILAPNATLLFGALPATRSVNLLNLALGLLGLLAFAASRQRQLRALISRTGSTMRRRIEGRRRRRQRRRALKRRRSGASPAPTPAPRRRRRSRATRERLEKQRLSDAGGSGDEDRPRPEPR